MTSITDRIAHYLLVRLRRKAISEIYRRAEDAGLLQSLFIVEADDKSGTVWQITDHARTLLTGGPAASEKIVARVLRVSHGGSGNGNADESGIDAHTVRSMPRGRLTPEPKSGEKRVRRKGPPASLAALSIERNLLAQIRRFAAKPTVADVAVALLMARAVGESVATLERLLTVLRQSNPFVVVRVPVRGFEQLFDRQLERGMMLPAKLDCMSAFSSYLPDVRSRASRKDKHVVATFTGLEMKEKSQGFRTTSLTTATLATKLPVVVIDETDRPLDARMSAGADLILGCEGIDRPLLIELMHVCCGIAPKTSWIALEASGFEPDGVGLDDLTLALRPGRNVSEIISVLGQLQRDAATDDDDARTKDGDGSNKGNRTSKAAISAAVDRIEPGMGARADEKRNGSQASDPILAVETLAGYGQARDWALELDADLTLLKQKTITWSQMSTRLLLSGPPGTGKTTFAKALCNTLRIPLLATSVGRWLEPGYLGDVLKVMAATFQTARESAPCILFIDEIDNIGRRSSTPRDHSDYWDTLINRMLELLDGASRTDGVVIVAATNAPDKIDPALLRSGRLERHIVIPIPGADALAGILAHHLGPDLDAVLRSRPSRDPRASEGAAAEATKRRLARQNQQPSTTRQDQTHEN